VRRSSWPEARSEPARSTAVAPPLPDPLTESESPAQAIGLELHSGRMPCHPPTGGVRVRRKHLDTHSCGRSRRWPYPLRGPNMMMDIPARQTPTPTQSDVEGRTLSTNISHTTATPMYTPP